MVGSLSVLGKDIRCIFDEVVGPGVNDWQFPLFHSGERQELVWHHVDRWDDVAIQLELWPRGSGIPPHVLSGYFLESKGPVRSDRCDYRADFGKPEQFIGRSNREWEHFQPWDSSTEPG
jgi:hypothetical protein